MSRDVDFSKKQIRDRLVGCKIVGAISDEENEYFGFQCVKGRAPNQKRFNVWIDSDAEGNAPGWITIEENPNPGTPEIDLK